MTTLYVKSIRYGNPAYFKYIGQDQNTITTLLTGLGATDIQFISEEEYLSAVSAS